MGRRAGRDAGAGGFARDPAALEEFYRGHVDAVRGIARTADGWMTTPTEGDLGAKTDLLRTIWADAGREGQPQIHALATSKPTPELLASWASAGVTDAIWGLPDKPVDEVVGFLGRHAKRLGLG